MLSSLVLYIKFIGLAIGSVFLILYLLKFKRHSTLAKGILSILSGNGIAAGIAVMFLSLDTKVCRLDQIEQIYIFIGGVAVTWVSISSFDKVLKSDKE